MTVTKPAEAEAHARPFADFLRELHRGDVHDELSDALHNLIARVEEVGKSGTLTLTLKVSKDRAKMIIVDDDVKVKLPDFPRESSAWYVDRAGNPTRKDPSQYEFQGLQKVETGDTADTDTDTTETGKVANA